MPSTSHASWTTTRAAQLDEIESAHAAVGGTGRGRRFATRQINHAYAVLLASQFQGFCRDLHSECVEYLVTAVASAPLRPILRDELRRNRQPERGNAQPGSVGSDFGRLGIDFWTEVNGHDRRNAARQGLLIELNDWRNAIAHQDFARLGGRGALRLGHIRLWRRACNRLASAFDEVMRRHLLDLSGSSPW